MSVVKEHKPKINNNGNASVRVLHWRPGASESYMLEEKTMRIQLGHCYSILRINEDVQNAEWVVIDISCTKAISPYTKIFAAFKTYHENIPVDVYGYRIYKRFKLYSTELLMSSIVKNCTETIIFMVNDYGEKGLEFEDLTYDHICFKYFSEYIDPAVVEREFSKKLVCSVQDKRGSTYTQFEASTIGRLFFSMPDDYRAEREREIQSKTKESYNLDAFRFHNGLKEIFDAHPGIIGPESFLDQNGMEEYKRVLRDVGGRPDG